MADRKKIDFSKATTVLEGSKDERDAFKEKVKGYIKSLEGEQSERKRINEIRRDFLLGNQASYTNIIGLQKKEKRGHTNAVFNYAGKTCIKIYYGLSNNPPNLKIPGIPVDPNLYKIESVRAQGVEDFLDHVLFLNRFWHHTYPRTVMNQITSASGAIKVFFDPKTKQIKLIHKEKMNDLLVGWRGDDAASFDFVIDRNQVTQASVEREFGIRVLPGAFEGDVQDETMVGGSHEEGGEYGTRSKTSTLSPIVPSGKTNLPKVWRTDYWDDKINMILINDEVVQYVEHTWGFNPWVLVPNIHVPGNPWGLSDIDFLIDPQIEYNEGSNDERDFIRAAVNIKYVAKNMEDFDPESLKTGSGQVIFVEGDDSDFAALPQPVNTFPAETYLTRVKKAIHDLGVPEVAYGTAGGDSGRSKAIDYQSLVDVIDDKRKNWTLALNEIAERIQILGYKYFPKEFFKNPETKEFEVRPIELDWNEIVPLTSSERVVNVVNKVSAGILSINSALSELGYKDVEKEIEKLRQEERDPELATIRHKVTELIPGVQEAAQQQMVEQAQAAPPSAAPTLTTGQNTEGKKPMSTGATKTAFSSPKGFIARTRQNMEAAGEG